jgi:hypothetical protein
MSIKSAISKLVLPGMILFLGMLASCVADRKIAKTFTETPPPFNFLIMTPDYIFKYNHKGEDIAGFDSMTQDQQDSALYSSSKFIQNIDDSTFLTGYINGFVDELRIYGFKVFLEEDVDTFLLQQPQSYVINIAQLQLDEYYYPLEDEATFWDTTYYKTFNLEALDFATWFEVNKMNAEKPKKTVLYASYTMTDGFEGSFFNEPWSANVRYKYKIDSLKVSDVYSLAGKLGQRHATYMYDFFLNQYIRYVLPKNEDPLYYYHYDHKHKTLVPVEDDMFEVIGVK